MFSIRDSSHLVFVSRKAWFTQGVLAGTQGYQPWVPLWLAWQSSSQLLS